MTVTRVSVTRDEAGQRFDRWLRRRYPGLTQGLIERSCRKGELRVDGARVKPSARVEAGQTVRIPPFDLSKGASGTDGHIAPDRKAERRLTKADIRTARSLIIHRDDHLVVVNKPPGLASQGGNRMSDHLDRLSAAMVPNGENRPRLVHRLDSETSGVMVLARTRSGAAHLSEQFRTDRVRKIYWAIVAGLPQPNEGTIKLGLIKARSQVKERSGPETASWHMRCVRLEDLASVPGARRAESQYHVIDSVAEEASWLALRPITGRTHQLRAHMAAIGHPIVGDRRYPFATWHDGGDVDEKPSGSSPKLPGTGLHLHARSISFEHPGTGEPVRFVADLPASLEASWDGLGWTDRNVPVDPFPEGSDR